MKRQLVRGALVLFVVGLVLAGWGFFVEPARLVAREEALPVPGWPPALNGLRVALLSDLHVGAPFIDAAKVREVRARIDAWRPDLVLLAGDVLVGHEPGARAVAPAQAVEPLKGWGAPLGVYATLGNHDWWVDGEATTRALEEAGLRVLENEAVPIETGRGRIWLAGLADVWTRKTDAERALSFVTDDAPVLAFTHNPDVFPDMPARFSVVFAGHTHGGQVRLPLLGAPIVPSKFGQRYARGAVVEDGRLLFVTTGVGTSVLPVRFGVAPEVALLTLVAR
ncbi:MAG: metallophosphoesterase [Myxococcaceae bacterium]|nr:metallophosphoesterase [Myxococcaceae bacterium]